MKQAVPLRFVLLQMLITLSDGADELLEGSAVTAG